MQIHTTEAEEKRYAELQLMALDFARHGDAEQLAAMLDHGLPVNLADHKGQTLLMLASYHGHTNATRLLLERGAEVDRRNMRGQTPLGGAAFKGHEQVVALLLQYGADIHADNGAGMTPVMFAAIFGRTNVVEQLTAHGASLPRKSWLIRLASQTIGFLRFLSQLLRPATRPQFKRQASTP